MFLSPRFFFVEFYCNYSGYLWFEFLYESIDDVENV